MMKLQKRRFVRFQVDWRAAVFVTQNGREKAIPARITDVSKEGIGLTLDSKLALDATYKMAMAIPAYDLSGQRFVTGKYKVIDCFVTTDGTFRAGAELTQIDQPNEEILMWFLREEARRLEWAYSRTTGKFEFVKEAYQ